MRIIPFLPAFQDDVIRLNALTVKSSAFIGRTVNPDWHEDLRDIPANYPGGVFLLAIEKSRLVGMGGLRKVDSVVADVTRIRVHPDFQGKGVARRILAALERKAHLLGFEKIVGHSASGNLPAERMFKKAGFAAVSEKDFCGVPCTVFEKAL